MSKAHSSNYDLNDSQPSKPSIERGASWSLHETRILLSLWGQDMVQRQFTNSKRTRQVWEKIAERIRDHGWERTPDQVRIKVFNMIAEYRRILKNPTPERKKKCVFFDALDKIYQAKDTEDVKAALNDYEEEYHFDPSDSNMADETNDSGMGANGDGENSGTDNEEVFSYAMSPSQTLNGNEGAYGQVDGDQYMGQPALRSRSGSNATYSGYQAQDYSSEYDSSQAVILIDRMFVHLTKEMDIMRDWIRLEKERFHQEAARRKEDNERQERREKAFLNALVSMQDQTYRFLAGSSSTFPIPPGSFDVSPMDTQSTFELS
ncbi:uncharacterized protein LOC128396392 isoform X2 [Panonychus citri]|uniref:uncharacterized protein LOC128396392 isoform X2 n=1 Tax=Panonychus citri TaxID=50023 RepID=UPI0023081F45|nr:uncharacterized protein LOC128396392 isoform X2 [Panonychus citri]